MALNQQRLIQIIMDESRKLPERCPGYRDEVIETLCEIITLERQHQREGIYIKQKIADKCNALGRLLAESQAK